MKQSILDRINALGGNTKNVTGKSFAKDWQAIQFDCVLYDKEFDGWGIPEFCEKNWELYLADEQAFFDKLLQAYFHPSEQDAYGQTFFKKNLFTPFTPETADYKEWNNLMTETVDFDELESITGQKNPEFIQLFYAYGYPDHYFAVLDDTKQDNPIVVETDHEEFFSSLSSNTLEELLDSFLTQPEFLEIARECVDEYKSEMQNK